jgi:hypothetical protein
MRGSDSQRGSGAGDAYVTDENARGTDRRTRGTTLNGRDGRDVGQRVSDVVPKYAGYPTLPPLMGDAVGTVHGKQDGHPSSLRVPDDAREIWMQAYEASFDQAFEKLEGGDALIPFVYAAGENDERLSRGLLAFAYEIALCLPNADEGFAMLEVAESTLSGAISKDVCIRIADNLVDEAYRRFESDRRFDRYFFCHCAAATARLVARVDQTASAKDATEVVLSAVAALRAFAEHEGKHDGDAADVRKLAAHCIRRELQREASGDREASANRDHTNTRS